MAAVLAAVSAATLIINVLRGASPQRSQDASHEAQRHQHHRLSASCNKDVCSEDNSEIDELQICCQCMCLTNTSEILHLKKWLLKEGE